MTGISCWWCSLLLLLSRECNNQPSQSVVTAGGGWRRDRHRLNRSTSLSQPCLPTNHRAFFANYDGEFDRTADNNATTNPTMIAAGGNGPLESHSRANLVRRRVELIGDNPPSKQMCLGVGLIGCMPLKTLLCSNDDAPPQHQSVLRGICPINPHKKHIRLLGGSSLINTTRGALPSVPRR